MKVLSGFLHIKEALDLFITSDETNNAESQVNIKFMSANSTRFRLRGLDDSVRAAECCGVYNSTIPEIF